jgi:predicted DNA-binding protein with PD1-like motif
MTTARPTLLRHPGPVARERVVSVATQLAEHEYELPAGARLLDAVADLLARTASVGAVGELVGGTLEAFDYFVPALGAPGGAVATFSDPHSGAAPARLIRGGVTIGRRAGEVFAHSHAVFEGRDGALRAGHLMPESVVLGAGVTARLAASADVRYEVAPDPETTMSLFTPMRVGAVSIGVAHGSRRGLVCRIRPNVDLATAIEELTVRQGWAAASVRGQIGSLVGGRLRQEDGSILEVEGPATEVMYLDGTVGPVDGRMSADLTLGMVDRFGRIHRGGLVRGLNPVAMTYELVLVESD